jgi:hypothetical protein
MTPLLFLFLFEMQEARSMVQDAEDLILDKHLR